MRLPDVPLSVNEISGKAHSLGLTFVERPLAQGGQAALDAVFRSPPESTEQVIHRDNFASHEPVAPVGFPPP